jgi:hypothetical protein
MFCPQTIVFSSKPLMIVRHERSDYHCGTPWAEVLNPLRYSFTLWPGTERWTTFNRNGWLARKLSDINWNVWKKRLPRYRLRA